MSNLRYITKKRIRCEECDTNLHDWEAHFCFECGYALCMDCVEERDSLELCSMCADEFDEEAGVAKPYHAHTFAPGTDRRYEVCHCGEVRSARAGVA